MSQPANLVTMKIVKPLNRVQSIILISNQFNLEGWDYEKNINFKNLS